MPQDDRSQAIQAGSGRGSAAPRLRHLPEAAGAPRRATSSRLLGGALPEPAPTRLSHELRTPLNAILGNAELLLDGSAGPLSSQARACLGDIQAAGRRLLRQVQVLLALCHAGSRPQIGSGTAIDLIELLRAAPAAAPEPGPALDVVPAGARFLVRGDPIWLGALAAALVDVSRGEGQDQARSQITVGVGGAAGFEAALRLWWPGFDADRLPALPTALIDAILDLHGGGAALTGDGLRLDWPAARAVQQPYPETAAARAPAGS